jgi:hypothetical protein
MSSKPDRGIGSTPDTSSRGWILLEFLKAARIPLLVGLLCFAGVFAMWYYGVPARSLGLVTLTVLFVVPLVAAYGLLYSWYYFSEVSEPVLIRDPEHDTIGLKELSPDEFADAEIEGDGLTTRRGEFTGRTVYVAEGHRWEERERVDQGAAEITPEPVRVLVGTWELELDYQTFVEEREEFNLWKQEVVPLAKSGLKERVGVDVRVLKKTDRLGHALVAGAEQDQYFAGDADPFGWSLDDEPDDLPGDLGDDPTAEEDESDDQDDIAALFEQAAAENGGAVSADATPDGGDPNEL